MVGWRAGRVQTGYAQQEQPERMLIPMGGGYSDIYPGFIEAVIARARQGQVNILVLPITFANDPREINPDLRLELLQSAENRRFQVDEACNRAAPANTLCNVSLAPVLVRADAMDPENLRYFTQDLTAIFILGGDASVAMRVIGGTPVEQALFQAHEQGIILAGTGAGGTILSPVMITGYTPTYSAGTSLKFGAVDVWNSSEQHGLVFGMQGATLDTQFYQLGRLGRLLNILSLPEGPHVGVGVDTYTGFLSPDGRSLEQVFGLYNVTVLDTQTYHSAQAVQYHGNDHTLSLRNVLIHLIPPGKFSFDLESRAFTSFGNSGANLQPPVKIERNFDDLQIPSGAGTLILAGDLSANLQNSPVIERFIQLAGGDASKILIYADGYPNLMTAELAASKYRLALGGEGPNLFIDPDQPRLLFMPNTAEYSGVMFIGSDQSLLHLDLLQGWLKQAWLSGMPVLADGAAAAALGQYYAAHPPNPTGGEELELATQKSMLAGNTNLREGLGFLPVNLEPQVMVGNRWGRMFSLAYNHPDLLTIGLNSDTALELNPASASILGDNTVISLDLRQATLDIGTNGGFAIANGLLDVFANGDRVAAQVANLFTSYTRAPTPFIPTPTVTPLPTATSQPPTAEPTRTPKPTNTPRPTPTPLTVPPPSDPDTTHLMVFFGTLMVLVVIFGILINRRRVFS